MDFNEICRRIKELKIQGAENVARYGIKALMIKHDENSIRKLLSLRATEPLLKNAVIFAKQDPQSRGRLALKHFADAENKIAKIGSKLIRNDYIVFTHCHSSTVVNVLKEARKTKMFRVNNTETRPLFQGRKTAMELARNNIRVAHFVDASADRAIRDADIMAIGADSITKNMVLNKVGSCMFAKLAKSYGVPVYVFVDSWKYDNNETPLEERPAKEVWNIKVKGIDIRNYAFDEVKHEYIEKIISEIGIYRPKDFINAVKTNYPWIQGRGDRGVELKNIPPQFSKWFL